MKKLYALIAPAAAYLTFANPAFADTSLNPCPGSPPWSTLCTFAQNPGNLIRGLVIAIFVIAAVVALFYLLYGGIRWIISEGDKSKVQEARNHIIAAVIGLIIVFLSFFVLNIILNLFGINLSNLSIPPISAQ